MIKRVLLVALSSITFIYASPLSYINSIRQKSGLMPLSLDSRLSLAAKKHATYVNKTKEFSHYENSTSPYYFASTPWNRIVKAGYRTKVVIENITFSENSYKESIDKLMATVYHRLAFLYNQIDKIGYARVGSIFVYDMSNSKVATLCNKHYKNALSIIDSVCPNSKDIIPANLFNKAMQKIMRRSKDIIVYPYKNQKNVPTLGLEETPKFLYSSFGHPITATFNKGYYNRVRLISFKLFEGSKEVDTKVVDSNNDLHNKIREDTFVLVPLKRLKPHTKYKVVLKAKADGKLKSKSWSFTTR